MENSRKQKILNYFYLIKLFNNNRDFAARFYLALDNSTKRFSFSTKIFQINLLNELDDFNVIKQREINYLDIWSSNLISIFNFVYDNKISISWNNRVIELTTDVIKNIVKVKFKNKEEFIANFTQFLSDIQDEITLEKILKSSGDILHYDDPIYPQYFKDNVVFSPPICFFYQGNIDLINNSRKISVVGTRNPTTLGIENTKKIVGELIKQDYVIVSGLAKEVDYISHYICRKSNYQQTIAVIGTPLANYYPRENMILQVWIKENGLLLSEYANFETTLRFNFLRRNNFMSLVSMASIVVEASDTSGTISQARNTLKNNRHLLATKYCFDNKDNSWPSKFKKDYNNLTHVFDAKKWFFINY